VCRTASHGRLMLLIVGAAVHALAGCDPAVRQTLLGGVQSATTGLATTFIQAFFQSLTSVEEPTVTV
jgi:hypothetical protein